MLEFNPINGWYWYLGPFILHVRIGYNHEHLWICCQWNLFVNSQYVLVLEKNCVWRQAKLYLTTSKLYCQKIVFDDKQNCIWQQENYVVKKLCLTTNKIVFDNKQIVLSKNCVWRQTKLYLTTSKLCCQKLCLTTKKNSFDNKQIVLPKNCVWGQAKLYLTTNKLYCCLNSLPHPQRSVELKTHHQWTLGVVSQCMASTFCHKVGLQKELIFWN